MIYSLADYVEGNPAVQWQQIDTPLTPLNTLEIGQLALPEVLNSNVLILAQPDHVANNTITLDIWDAGDCEDCGQQCAILIHEQLTGWWFQWVSGSCVQAASDFNNGCNTTCNPPACSSCFKDCERCSCVFSFGGFVCTPNGGAQCWQTLLDSIRNEQIPNGFSLSVFFPGAVLSAAGFDPTEAAYFDAIIQVCDTPTFETIPLPLPSNSQPPPDSPPPTYGGPFLDPPLPLASDGIGFSMPAGPFALPVHPVLSAARVREVCGTCGPDDSEGISEELEL
jgi:hypothetical protein